MADIEDRTDDVLREADKLISHNLALAALMVERTAKKIVAVKTGTLKRSITHEPVVPKREVRIGTNIEYAPFVELGTSKQSAQPYLRPALESNMEKIRKLFEAS